MHTTISRDQARALLLAAQGLDHPPAAPPQKHTLVETIRRMGVLQIDTINIVNRSPYLVLWSRLGDYPLGWLDDLLAERAIFEYWSHEASFLPIEDYPLYRRLMRDGRKGWHHKSKWAAAYGSIAQEMLAHVRANGPVRSADFTRTDGQSGTWWNWKEEKMALEYLHSAGDLMIARRHNFQRIYDLRERVLPDWDDDEMPVYEEVRRVLVLKAVKALGVALAKWVPDYFRTPKKDAPPLLETLADEGFLLRVMVEDWPETAYIHRDYAGFLERDTRPPTHTTLLSPFDPVVWDRARASALFDFDYRIECYTPAPKRRYGYFTLPILSRGRLVGRLDPKAHRKEGVFEVKALYLEPGVPVTDRLVTDLAASLRACAAWHQTPQVVVRTSEPPAFGERLARALA